MSKKEKLKELAVRRKSFYFEGFHGISEFQNGIFDHEDFVSPWSIDAHNLDADLMLVGQDWASSAWLSNPKNLQYASLGRNPNLITNRNLDQYLNLFGLKFSDTYATNAFVGIKKGGMSANIPKRLLSASIENFLFPQIEIVKPRMIICLGSMTLNSIRKLIKCPRVKIGIGHENPALLKGSYLYGVHHTGGHGTKNAGGKEAASKQWESLAKAYQNIKLGIKPT